MYFASNLSYCFRLAERADFFLFQPLRNALAMEDVFALQLHNLSVFLKFVAADNTFLFSVLGRNELPFGNFCDLGSAQAFGNLAYLLFKLQELLG
jgi:hypothetical protein